MALGIAYHQFTVNAVPVTVDVPTRLNIKKRREHIVYRSLSNSDNVNIAYVAGQDSRADVNLTVSDRSTSLVQNRLPGEGDITTITGISFNIGVEQFLVTDQFTTITPTQPEKPLFYVHTLKNFNSTVAGFGSNISLVSIEFMDYEFNTIQFSEYILDATNGLLYNNLENSYNSLTDVADITLIKYTVKTISGGRSTIAVYHELIDNVPVYTLAEFDDLDGSGNLKTDIKKYIIEEISGIFTVTLPVSNRYSYKELPESRLNILSPASSTIDNPWYVRITNGKFIASLPHTKSLLWDYTYRIAEFNSQSFEPYPPYKLQVEEEGEWVTKNILHSAKNIVYDPDQKLFVDCVVFDRADTLKYVFSNDLDKVGTNYQDTDTLYTNDILSVDQSSGFIEVNQEIAIDDKIYITYYTEEKEYEFTKIDFNPTNNLDVFNQRIVVYVTPESTTTFDKSLYYLVVNPLGEILYSSQAEENATGTDTATVKMLTEDFETTGKPKHLFYYDVASTASGLLSRWADPIFTATNEISFIDKYTAESQLYVNYIATSGTAELNFQDNPKYLVLADMYVGESQRPESMQVFDVRVQGGGIKEEYLRDALTEQPEVQWYWDLPQQRPYPGTTAFYVEVPDSILKEHGGRFEKTELTALIERHMQLGGYAVVKSYGIEPTINNYIAQSGVISITWPSYGSDVTYNIFKNTTLDGVYTQLTSIELPNVDSGNWYAASGLNSSTKYYFYVESIKDGQSSYGPTVALSTTANIS